MILGVLLRDWGSLISVSVPANLTPHLNGLNLSRMNCLCQSILLQRRETKIEEPFWVKLGFYVTMCVT